MIQSENLRAFFNIPMQFAIPFLICSVVLILVMVLRKFYKLESILLTAAVVGLTAFLGVSGVSRYLALREAEPTDDVLVLADEQKENNKILAAQYLKNKCYDEARDLLDEMYRSGCDDGFTTLLSAYLSSMTGDFRTALPLYQKAEEAGMECKKELSLLQEILSGSATNSSTRIYLAENGRDPAEYGMSADASASRDGKISALQELVDDRVDQYLFAAADSAKTEQSVRAAKGAAALMEAFRKGAGGLEPDFESVDSALKKITKAMKADPVLSRNNSLRVALMKGYLLKGDWAKIGGMLDEFSGAEELIIATELYRNGLITGKDIPDEFLNKGNPHQPEVVEICREIYDEKLADADKVVRKAYEAKLDDLENYGKGGAMPALILHMNEIVEEQPTGELSSKVYLELAKAEQSLGKSSVSDMYLEKAFGSVSYCTDDGYTVPMNKLLGIVNGNDDNGSDEVKNVSIYVNDALENSLPEGISPEALEAAAEQPVEGEETLDFETHMKDAVVQMTAVLNIGAIDVSQFPEITARIQVNSPTAAELSDVKKALRVTDCGSEIEDFELKKVEVSTSRIIMVCDVSGSMSGSVRSLQNAITSFASELEENEEVYVIGFDDQIEFQSGRFLTTAEEINEFADRMGAYGGTDMYNPLKTALELFPNDVNANNVIILLTDGEDNYPQKESTIRSEITPLAKRYNATVYTLGLGSSVNTDYLTLLAEAGNGSFLYVDSDESLEEFYTFLHGQLSNQYILTYTAKNKTLNERKLEISLDGCLGSAVKTYYRQEPEYNDLSEDAYSPYIVQDEDLAVYGLSTKLLYLSSSEQSVLLKGSGFDAGDTITVHMADNVKYTLRSEFVDPKTIRLYIPANAATGVYSLSVLVRETSFELKDELTIVVPGKIRSFTYGDYEFTAFNMVKNSDGSTTLSGNVQMNGWLNFKGNLVVKSDLQNSTRLYLYDGSGSYVNFTGKENLSSLAQYMADRNVPAELAPLGDFYITNAPYTPEEYESFEVNEINLGSFCVNLLILQIDDCSVRIYPDTIRMEIVDLSYSLPLQKQILRQMPNHSVFKKALEQKGGVEISGMLGANDIGILGELSAELFYKKDDPRGQITLVSLPLRLEKLSFTFDTLKNDYLLEGDVKLVTFPDQADTLSLKFGVKDAKPDCIGIQIDGDYRVTLVAAPFPITIGDFGFEVNNLSQYWDEEDTHSTLEKILATKIQFNFETYCGDVASKFPKLKKLFGDDKELSLAVLKNCALSCQLKDFRVEFDCDLFLFGALSAGHANVKAGTFPYQSRLLGINTEKQYGLGVAVTLGDTWKANQVELTLKVTGEAVIGYPVFLSAQLGGEFGFDVGWWIFRADFDVTGDAGIGLFMNSFDEFQFTLAASGSKNGAYSGFNLTITPSTGLDTYVY